jgi:hypothetical protein
MLPLSRRVVRSARSATSVDESALRLVRAARVKGIEVTRFARVYEHDINGVPTEANLFRQVLAFV